jgi:hypothetical protein
MTHYDVALRGSDGHTALVIALSIAIVLGLLSILVRLARGSKVHPTH